jgi:hypothetical protein
MYSRAATARRIYRPVKPIFRICYQIHQAIIHNLSAKADKSKSGEALPFVRIIGSANYYHLLLRKIAPVRAGLQ